jgi:hypothetical protein
MSNPNLFPDDHDHEFTEDDLLTFLGVIPENVDSKPKATNNNDEFYVYLAGPIEKELTITNPHSIIWREKVLEQFDQHHLVWDILDPTRGKKAKDGHGNWVYSFDTAKDFHYNPFFIFSRDLEDIDKSEIVVINLVDAAALSIGTNFEFGYAYANEKFLIVVCPDTQIRNHPFVSQASDIIIDSEEQIVEACAYARNFLNQNGNGNGNVHSKTKEPRIYRIDKGFA